jgi:hypothetical protein
MLDTGRHEEDTKGQHREYLFGVRRIAWLLYPRRSAHTWASSSQALTLAPPQFNPSNTMRIAGILLSYASVGMAFMVSDPKMSINSVPFSTRAHWMRRANAALRDVTGSPCPFAAFGTVIVNHTDTDGLGDLVCIGANENSITGNPTLHGQHVSVNLGGI